MFLPKQEGKVGFLGKTPVKIRPHPPRRKKYLLKTAKKDFCIIFPRLEILYL